VSSFLTAHQHTIGHFHHKNYKDVTQTKVAAAKADTDDATQCNTTVTTDEDINIPLKKSNVRNKEV